MQLVNEFVVPRGVDETWAVLTDVERIAPCMPGAQLGEVVDGVYHGTVKVKVGPVTAQYAGTATFREQDQVNHHMVLEANGKESSGRGRASALVTADLAPDGAGTRVKVVTDMTISGPLAQFGRGAIAEVSTKLLNQFVAQLEATVLAGGPATAPPPAASGVTSVAGPPAAAPPATAPPATGPSATEPAATGPSATEPAATTPAAVPVAKPSVAAPAAEVNLLKVAAWPILKRLIPLLVAIAVVVVLLVWWLG